MAIDFRVRPPVDDDELSRLHHDAFGGVYEFVPWRSRLERHSKSWICAFDSGELCGFVHAAWDGGKHAFLLDTAVATRWRHQAIGTQLVSYIVSDLRTTDVEWLHVDYEAQLDEFYSIACGFDSTSAGILRLK
ncbi:MULTISPECIES: GNAT family N-acetyltransferase [Nocardiaceae]|jgi:N-acetylglutamate synthase-like GNAT family acetyltransferase|uniref:GNAT family N-acetyltransferase n=1 Tax=Nocardiaceae TaxID=85025 RepID=UPI0005EBE123|nr:GNAT family N-acetyltransferase [Rhodococcus sp. (in: high G+C Gram-positive bacteria)]